MTAVGIPPIAQPVESCLIARKRYLPREVKQKGTLEALGVQRLSAVERMSTHGKRLLQDRWTGHEHDITRRRWSAGLSVPYPISYGDDLFDLEYTGNHSGAAPQLHAARLRDADLAHAFDQLVTGLEIMTTEGIVHGDLSSYNLLWWDNRLWFIDFPQALDIAANLQGFDFLHRDVVNVCTWFQRQGLDVDADSLFGDLLALL